ncbi:hypothetical protein UF64_10290 [Thalassospira sp. HJ]|nr:hypothetical protein UF64_10290 [Thalassospira sp. HJ]
MTRHTKTGTITALFPDQECRVVTDTKQPSDHHPHDIVATLANMSFQTLCQEITLLPDDDDGIDKLRAAASDEEKSLIDILIALRGSRLGEIAPLFANAGDDITDAKITSSDVPDNMLSLLTALKAATSSVT